MATISGVKGAHPSVDSWWFAVKLCFRSVALDIFGLMCSSWTGNRVGQKCLRSSQKFISVRWSWRLDDRADEHSIYYLRAIAIHLLSLSPQGRMFPTLIDKWDLAASKSWLPKNVHVRQRVIVRNHKVSTFQLEPLRWQFLWKYGKLRTSSVESLFALLLGYPE